MPTHLPPLSLKPYLDAIEQLCSSLSKQQLIALILGLAGDVPARERTSHLLTLQLASKGPRKVVCNANLAEQIAGLVDDIRERVASIENGDYGDIQDEYDSWDDQEPPMLSDEQQEQFSELLAEADHLFLSGNLADAQCAYAALLALFGDSGEGVLDESAVDADLRETRARHCRCVYETSAESERAEAFWAAMQVDSDRGEIFAADSLSLPMLTDVMGARRGKMQSIDAFLAAWKTLLARGTSLRAARLLVEAILQSDGPQDAAKAAARLGKKHPAVYAYFVALLQERKLWDESVSVSHAALKRMNQGSERAQVAALLRKAGERREDRKLVLFAKREEFFSTPEDGTLRQLLQEVDSEKWQEELAGVLRYLDTRQSTECQPGLRIKVLLMDRRLETAFAQGSSGKPVGWSYVDSGTGMLYGAVLYALANTKAEEPPIIKRLIDLYAQERHSMHFIYESESIPCPAQASTSGSKTFFAEAICAAMRVVSVDDEARRMYEDWAKKKADARITHIVANKHRRAYERAAEVLVALAEYYTLQGNPATAERLVCKYLNRYNRHSAFKSEVQKVLRASLKSHPVCPG